ncbi:protein B4 [Rhincodon typus]|uniref:protein B4 n=1 Tax=Rhincodon typus TaxID=259920 RepID=UPI002030D527|nr:protein B4 [Rhincodon typus]
MAPKRLSAVTKVTVSTTVGDRIVALKSRRQSLQGVRASTLIIYKRPPVIKMVVNALKKSKDRKGTTVAAIRNYILTTYPTVNPVYLKTSLKKALAIGLEKGILVRPANSKATGATGRFKLASKSDLKRNNENVDPNSGSVKMTATKVKAKVKKTEADKKADTKSKTQSAHTSKGKGEKSGKVKKLGQSSLPKPKGNNSKKSKAVKEEPDSLPKVPLKKASNLLPQTGTGMKQGPKSKSKKRELNQAPSSSEDTQLPAPKTGSSAPGLTVKAAEGLSKKAESKTKDKSTKK